MPGRDRADLRINNPTIKSIGIFEIIALSMRPGLPCKEK